MPVLSSTDTAKSILLPNEKIKAASYLCYAAAIIGGASYPLFGLVSPQIAAHFAIPTAKIVFIDVLCLVGLIIGNTLSGKLIERLGGKQTLMIAGSLLAAVQLSLALQDNLIVYAALVLVNGFAFGLCVPSLSYLIVACFDRQGRSEAKLSVLNFFFGIGGCIGPSILGLIVEHGSWRSGFIFTAIMYAVIFIVAKFVNIMELYGDKRPDASVKQSGSNKSGIRQAINAGVLVTGLALIAYVYAEYVITYWFSPYLQETQGYSVSTVGFVIGLYWLSVALGRILFGEFVIPRVKDVKFLITMALLLAAGFLVFVSASGKVLVFATIILLGLACSSIFPVLLGYGMKQSPGVSPIAMAFLVCCGSIGGAVSLVSSATIGLAMSKVTAIYMGPVCCLLIIALVLLAAKIKRGE